MYKLSGTILFSVILLMTTSCENREVNANEGPNFSEIHEDIQYNFDKVTIDEIDYLILERDRNNPHEGFGFMALNGTQLLSNQDSIKAYLKTIVDQQAQILSKLNNEDISTSEENTNLLLDSYLQMQMGTKKAEND